MIRVTVELVPHGVESQKYTLGVATIANDGTGTPTRGNYTAAFRRTRGGFISGKVTGFPRKRLACWDLLYRALRSSVIGVRNP